MPEPNWNDEPKEERQQEEERMEIDEKADFHSRLSTLESALIRTNRRITRLEDNNRGNYSSDGLGSIFSPGFMWAMVLLTLAPVIVELVKQWRSESS